MLNHRILKLDEVTASKIAAGEVVEKPAMVVKELVENAIDAGASEITVSIKKGGKKQMMVSDNGSGINPDDIDLVFERHATSKIRQIEDLYQTRSLGFRGEALASISAVSEVSLITKRTEDEVGISVTSTGGKILDKKPIGTVKGTSISVDNLFFNTPARLKFLKSNSAETKAIGELMSHLGLSHPEIAFKYIVDDKNIFLTPGKGDLKQSIFSIYDKTMLNHLFEVKEEAMGIKVYGYSSTYDYTKGNSTYEIVFVNGRFVKSQEIKEAVQLAYKPYLMNNRFPVTFLFIEIDPQEVDVNIHPQKTEIKFHDVGIVKQVIFTALKKAFNLQNQIPEVSFTAKEIEKAPIAPQVSHSQPLMNDEDVHQKPKPQAEESRGMETKVLKAQTDKLKDKPKDNPKDMTSPTGNVQVSKLMSHPDNQPKEFINQEAIKNRLNQDDSVEKNHLRVAESQSNYSPASKEPPIDFEQYDFSELTTFAEAYNEPIETTIYDGLRYIGVFLNTYLIFEKEGAMYMIDQHAAHEKVLYEQFMEAYAKHTIQSQMLLIPETITLSYFDLSTVEEHQKDYENAGFQIDIFGRDAVVLRGIPSMFDLASAKELFESMVEETGRSVEGTISEKLMTKACKAAIKAYHPVQNVEVEALLESLKSLKDPYTCPHGRPIIIKFTEYELERKFKRVL